MSPKKNSHSVRPITLLPFLSLPLVLLLSVPSSGLEQTEAAAPLNSKQMPAPQNLWPADGAIYYSFNTANGSKAHVVVVNYLDGKWTIKPHLNEKNQTTSQVAINTRSSAAVNGGYFNLSDGASASFVITDGQELANPKNNKALIGNPKLAPYMHEIQNRSEVRFLLDPQDKTAIQIVRHDTPIQHGYKLVHSLQAGPQLLPALTEREEAFVRTDSDGTTTDAISSASPAARTAFGITSDGYAILVCVSSDKQDPESSGMTLTQLADLLKSLGCTQALNLDGGASSTMFVRTTSEGQEPGALPAGKTVCGRTPETQVKSVLLLQPTAKP